MATLLSSVVQTSWLIKILIQKQQKRSLGSSAEGLFSVLVSGVSRRQETLPQSGCCLGRVCPSLCPQPFKLSSTVSGTKPLFASFFLLVPTEC